MLRRCFQKKSCILVAVLVLLVVGAAGFKFRHYILNFGHYTGLVYDRTAVLVLNRQKVLIDIPPEMDAGDLVIQWNGLLDGSLPTNVVVFDGDLKLKKIPLGAGSHGFSIFYDDILIKTVGHFVLSSHRFHDYWFGFRKQGDEVDVLFKAVGPDSLTTREWDEMYHSTRGPLLAATLSAPLSVPSGASSVDNLLDFTLPSGDYQRLILPGTDTSIKRISGTVNDHEYEVNSLKTRGTSSLHFRRKNYNVKLDDAALLVSHSGETREMKAFTLLSLSMDHYYVRTALAHDLLIELGLMEMFHSCTELRMNGATQGLYFMVEHPKIHMQDSLNASFLIRRGFEHSLRSGRGTMERNDIEYDAMEYLPEADIDAFLDQYMQVFELTHTQKGEQLYQSLLQIMDVEAYMRLMAFNYLVCNHDYTDEIYFYIDGDSEEPRFEFLPWDFDDIFGNSPHEGWKIRNELIGDKLVYSAQSQLDLTIALDPVLYGKYLAELRRMTDRLDSGSLRRIFEGVYHELYASYNWPEIMEQSVHDAYTTRYTLKDLDEQLNGLYAYLTQRVQAVRTKLDASGQ